MRRNETPGRIVTNCCTGVGVHVPKMALILGNGGLDVRFYVRDSKKAHSWAERRVWRILCQNPSIALGCSELQEPQKKQKNGKKTSRVNTFGAQSHACAETKPLGGS